MFEHPHMFGCPPCVWIPLICLDATHMFGWPTHLGGVLMPPIHLFTPICLDTLHMFGCPMYIYNIKKACFVRLRGCPYTHTFGCPAVCLDAPCMFGCHSYVWMSPYVWTPPIYLDALLNVWMPTCMFGCPHICSTAGKSFQSAAMFGCPLYLLMPHMFGHHTCGCHFGFLDFILS